VSCVLFVVIVCYFCCVVLCSACKVKMSSSDSESPEPKRKIGVVNKENTKGEHDIDLMGRGRNCDFKKD